MINNLDLPFNETVHTAPQHPGRVWTFRLLYGRPPKGLSSNDRAHWRTKAAATAEVRHMVSTRAVQLKIPKLQRVRVESAWFVRDKRRRDTDNAAPFLKAVYDGLGADRGVSAHIVPDDAPEFMDKVALRIIHEVGVTPHFMFTITDLSE